MRVAICTPCRDGYVRHEHMLSCIDTFVMARKRNVELYHFVAAGCSLLARTRNQLVASALEKNCDWLVFIDDDIAFDAKDFFRLLDHDVDVVGAAPARRHRRWDDEPKIAVKPIHGDKVTEFQTEAGRIWEVERLATAFLAIRTSVFKTIEPLTELFRCEENRLKTRTWFYHDLIEINGELWDEGEDYNFCRKWASVGGTCFLDPDIRLRHYDGNVCFDYCPSDMEKENNGESNVDRRGLSDDRWRRKAV